MLSTAKHGTNKTKIISRIRLKLLYVRKTINFRFINFKIVIYCRFMSFLGSDLLSISFCHLIEREKCARDKLENGLKNLSTSPILTRHNATERQKKWQPTSSLCKALEKFHDFFLTLEHLLRKVLFMFHKGISSHFYFIPLS